MELTALKKETFKEFNTNVSLDKFTLQAEYYKYLSAISLEESSSTENSPNLNL